MTARHTQGPWIDDGETYVWDMDPNAPEARLIATAFRDDAEALANAALIASAPALLAERDKLRATVAELAGALERLLALDSVNALRDALDARVAARAALAKVQPTDDYDDSDDSDRIARDERRAGA